VPPGPIKRPQDIPDSDHLEPQTGRLLAERSLDRPGQVRGEHAEVPILCGCRQRLSEQRPEPTVQRPRTQRQPVQRQLEGNQLEAPTFKVSRSGDDYWGDIETGEGG